MASILLQVLHLTPMFYAGTLGSEHHLIPWLLELFGFLALASLSSFSQPLHAFENRSTSKQLQQQYMLLSIELSGSSNLQVIPKLSIVLSIMLFGFCEATFRLCNFHSHSSIPSIMRNHSFSRLYLFMLQNASLLQKRPPAAWHKE